MDVADDDRVTRLVALLADRDRQLADRLVLGDLEQRLDRSAAVVEDLTARLAAAEDAADAATARADAATARAAVAEAELGVLRAAHPPHPAPADVFKRAVGAVRGRGR